MRMLLLDGLTGLLWLPISNSILSKCGKSSAIIYIQKKPFKWAGIEQGQNLLAVCVGAGENHLTWAAYIICILFILFSINFLGC